MAAPGIDEPLVGQRQPKIFFYEADGLGSVTSLTDPTGAVAATYTYDSFGFLTNSTGSATNWFRYTARQFDSDTALYYYRARYYDPTIGRFISEDPIRFTGGRNFYVYVGNNSSSRTDPFGLCPKVDCSQPPPAPPPAPPGVDVNAVIQQAAAVAQTQVADPQTGVSFDSTTAWLYSQFQTGGPQDYKASGEQYVPFGNFNYGAACGAIGNGLQFCQSAAGAALIVRVGWRNTLYSLGLGKQHYKYNGSGIPFLIPPYGDQASDSAEVAQGYYYQQWMEQCRGNTD